jgi:hypothetical protein
MEESLPLAWQKIGALRVSVFCSFTDLRLPLIFLHLLCNDLLLVVEWKGE